MENSDQIPEYVIAFIQGVADEQQKELVKGWIAEERNAETFALLNRINSLSGDLRLYEKFDLKEGEKSVYRKLRSNKVAKIWGGIQKAAAVLFVPVLLAAIWYMSQSINLKKNIAEFQVPQEITTQPGVKTHFFLPDSTEVWLNTSSKVRFPSAFMGNNRTIELDGEAYFKVFKDKKRPFIVKAGPLNVTALGTAFNIYAYSEDKIFSATLKEGKVKITNSLIKGNSYILTPGEQISYCSNGQKTSINRVDVDDVISWKDGKLIFNQAPFSDVVTRLGRWFNVDIQLTDSTIAKYRYTATFTNENVIQVLELLKLTAPIEYTSSVRKVLDNKNFSREEIKIWGNPDAKIILNRIK